ncbi:hypothetical protein D9V37_03665 [Nocardioides mangrovicus]|uniref:AtpZ/AtpI family protein n=1 Tax=Nocardioides mangrovicus TaxID=2478913 RepID=A0A3L8P8X2_9ACTN|nr:AtpZ/AtpI family protein [Nocardioides mangrovicus]RLV51028.1 hypothetical protein D9V37_03665 [Nocardioides mangrovicus]
MADDDPKPDPGGPGSAGLRGRDLIGLGGMLVGAVVAGLVVGYLVDSAAGTDPLFTILGIFLGIVAAVVGFVVKARGALRG